MKFISSNREKDEILKFLRDWVRLLSQGKFEEAGSWLEQSRSARDPNLLKDAIFSYSPAYRDAKRFNKMRHAPSIEDPCEMDLTRERFEIWMYEQLDSNHREVAGVEYFLPLNGKWSSMRAEFQIRDFGDGRYGFRLTDISVP